MFCKDRVFSEFRSLYAQRPAQSSVLCHSFVFDAEVAEYAYISCVARLHRNMLAQEGISERIPRLSAQIVNASLSTDPDCLHYVY